MSLYQLIMLISVKAQRDEPSRLAESIEQRILKNPLENEITWRTDSLRGLVTELWIEPSLPCPAKDEIELRIFTGLDVISRKRISRHTFGIPVVLLSNWTNVDCVKFSSSLIDRLCYYANLKLGMLVNLSGVEPMELILNVLFLNQHAKFSCNKEKGRQLSRRFNIPISQIEARPELFCELYRLTLPSNIDDLMWQIYHEEWSASAYELMNNNYQVKTFVNCLSLLKCTEVCSLVGAGGCQ